MTKRKINSALKAWTNHVKRVMSAEKCTYRAAMKKAKSGKHGAEWKKIMKGGNGAPAAAPAAATPLVPAPVVPAAAPAAVPPVAAPAAQKGGEAQPMDANTLQGGLTGAAVGGGSRRRKASVTARRMKSMHKRRRTERKH